ncbi:hypothetical protein BC827DRAFT_1249175 [Russula dissimulans]|nr:hypothetical protein BC827DRAFT_1249175 [Russula dissimulans]
MPVVSVRWNVRMYTYTPDLVKTTARWAARAPCGVTHAPNPFSQSRNWERVSLHLKLMPHYADSFERRMGLPPHFHLHMGAVSSNTSITSSTTVSTVGDSPTSD